MARKANERDFLDHYHQSSFQSIQRATIAGLMIYDLHIFWDFFKSSHDFMLIWAIRVLLVTPIILLMIQLIGMDFGRRHIRSVTLLAAIVVTSSVFAIHAISNPAELPAHASGILLTMLFCMTTLRMLRIEAIIYSVVSALMMFGLLYFRESPADVWITNIVNIVVACAIGLSASLLMESYARRSFRDEQSIRMEQAKSESLLLNTFPLEVATQLKSGQATVAEYADQVTVLFADLVGFTSASSSMSPAELVEQLDGIFSCFDRLTAQFGCEKIKTIGDAYMAVSGVPYHAADHADRIVNLALAMHAAARGLTLNGVPLSLRIGVHTGPVVAGVIGKSRFAYDLWGDTVNMASRMESTAEKDSIQISESTYQNLRGAISATKRGPIEIKGKGFVETWTLDLSSELGNSDNWISNVS